ncbi:hypothetical protein [Streptomyces sp. NPDC059916]|uniref:hypothetical protein n=1 Tax=Streptomyces sp. NPDC059916 TaxID=3347001 RepID=UPI0036B9ECEE
MNLGELITALEAADPTLVVEHGFNNPHSYRGDYMELAFEPATTVPVQDMITAARSALDTTYTGYKGGEFTMTADTWVWLSPYGDASCETLSPLALQAMLTRPAAPSVPADQAAENARLQVKVQELTAALDRACRDAAAAGRAAEAIDWKAKYEAEHARHVAVVSSLVADRPAVLREAANGLAALGPVDSLVSAPAAWTEAIETLRSMADQIAEDGLRRKANEAQQEADHA